MIGEFAKRTFLICDAGDGGLVLNVTVTTEGLLELLSEGYEAEDLDDIARWAEKAELGAVHEGEYICIIRVRDDVVVPLHGEIR